MTATRPAGCCDVYQQYFMVTAGAQLILATGGAAARGCDYHDLADYAVIQINDTHPIHGHPGADPSADASRGMEFDEAVEMVDQDLRLHQPHHPGRGPGEVALRLSGMPWSRS